MQKIERWSEKKQKKHQNAKNHKISANEETLCIGCQELNVKFWSAEIRTFCWLYLELGLL